MQTEKAVMGGNAQHLMGSETKVSGHTALGGHGCRGVHSGAISRDPITHILELLSQDVSGNQRRHIDGLQHSLAWEFHLKGFSAKQM